MRTLVEAKSAFAAVDKLNQGQTMRLLKLEKAFQSFTEDVFDLVDECPDRTAALRKLLEAKWTLCHAVTHVAQEKKNAEKKN